VAIAQLRSVAASVALPIVGMGGVGEASDAREMIAAGASLVAVGTESFRDPRAGYRIGADLAIPNIEQPDLDLRSRSR
jgi:dihydroorotate dehydrogenase (NAD+) catalytic subunit